MSIKLRGSKGKFGFTLVELLIVMAIIGVLATVGIPTFRRMIQKSKKTEAKVNLGGLFTAEAGFNAEYNAYGNNVAMMGYQIEGDPNTLVYLNGFFSNTCQDFIGSGPMVPGVQISPTTSVIQTVNPTNQSNAFIYASINNAYPAYYLQGNSSAGSLFMANQIKQCQGVQGIAASVAFNSAGNGQSYVAGSVGVISPTALSNAATGQSFSGANLDIWTMDNNRKLSNIQDGTL